MNTVLIVDDEPAAVQTIRRAVEWKSLGVCCVLTAASGFEAQRLLEARQVQVMLCDIEMPRMSGLTLLEWTKEHSPVTEVIILTCYASFSMAQKAMHLGGIEYVLKPVSPAELTRSLERALQLYSKKAASRAADEAWRESLTLRRRQYLSDILAQNISSAPQTLENYAEKYGVPFSRDELLHTLLLGVEDWKDVTRPSHRQTLLYGVSNFAQELWSRYAGLWSGLLHLENDGLLLVGAAADAQACFEQEAAGALEIFCQEQLHVQVRAFWSGPCRYEGLYRQVEELRMLRTRSCLSAPGNKKQTADIAWRQLRQQWGEKLQAGQGQEIQQQISQLLQSVWSSSTQREIYINHIKETLLEAVEKLLQQRQVDAALLLEENPVGQQAEFFTRTQFLAWTQWTLQRAWQAVQGTESEALVVKKIKEYIVLNIHQPLTRESIAASVYLNPDYTARIFKKETGVSLNDYILRKRIELAKLLLASSDISIGELAQNLGYASFSHFTKIFKASEGVMPSEYRKLHGQEK